MLVSLRVRRAQQGFGPLNIVIKFENKENGIRVAFLFEKIF